MRTRAWLWVTVVVFALAIPLGYAPLFVLGPTLAEDGYGTAAIFGHPDHRVRRRRAGGSTSGLRWQPEHPMRAAFLVIAAWPFMVVAFALGAPVAVILVLGAATGAGFALFDILWNTAMAERIPPQALSPCQLVRVDGFADPAAGGLPRRRAGGRGHQSGNRAHRGRGS